ncbi:MAG: hypothetical protein ACJ8EL_11735 [Rhizomicrobium sp.]|jgi:hypothetical protein
MRNLNKLVVPAALLLAGSLVSARAAGPHAPTVISGDCKFKKTAYVESDSENSTLATTYINVSDGAVSFTQGGRITGCVAVHFEAQSAGTGSASLLVRALLDGTSMFPSEIYFAGHDVVTATHGFSWYGTAAPGSHTVQIQYRSSETGTYVFIEPHVTTVQHQ